MEQSSFNPTTSVRKKVKKITLTAAIALGVICFIIGLLFGGAFSSGKDLDEAQQKIEELEFSLEDQTAKNQELKDTYIEQIDKLKVKNQELKNQLNSAEKADPADKDSDEDDATASELGDEEKSESGGFLKTFIIIILIVAVIVCAFFAVSIFLRRNREEDDDYDDDDEYYDDDDDEDEDDDDEYYDDDDEDADDDYDDDDEDDEE